MAFPYNSNIPQPGDIPANSQPIVQSNFSSIQSLVDIDHVDFAAATPGQHNKVSLLNQAGLPVFNPLGMIGLYSQANAISGQNELYVNKTNASGVVQVPSTASILSTTAAPSALSAGWSYLPSGILLKWSANVNANGQTTITFPVGATIPAFTTCFTVFVQIANGGAGDVNQAIRLTGVNPTNFSVYASNRTTTGAVAVVFTYLAIGY